MDGGIFNGQSVRRVEEGGGERAKVMEAPRTGVEAWPRPLLHQPHCRRLFGNTTALGEENKMTWGHDGHGGVQGSLCCFLWGRDGPVLGLLACSKDRLLSGEKVPVPPTPRPFLGATMTLVPRCVPGQQLWDL